MCPLVTTAALRLSFRLHQENHSTYSPLLVFPTSLGNWHLWTPCFDLAGTATLQPHRQPASNMDLPAFTVRVTSCCDLLRGHLAAADVSAMCSVASEMSTIYFLQGVRPSEPSLPIGVSQPPAISQLDTEQVKTCCKPPFLLCCQS